MSTESNKQVVRELFARFSSDDIDGVLEILHADLEWTIPGRKELNPAAGPYDRETIGQLFRTMSSQIEGGLAMEVLGMIAEGDRVAVEVESHGQLRNGRVYNNQYHFAMTLRDERIVEVKEYLDTQHVFATWFQQ